MTVEKVKCQTPGCNNLVDSKYKYCQDCYEEYKKKEKPKNKSSDDSDDVVDALGKVNNNLYAIRTLLEHQLKIETGEILVWDKETKKFKIVGATTGQ